MAAHTDLDVLFKRLHLANARRVWRQMVERAERESWAYGDFLTLLATEEIAHRQQTRLARLTRRARFPFLKTIDDFNFTYQSTLRIHMLGSALAPDFVTEDGSVILSVKTGTWQNPFGDRHRVSSDSEWLRCLLHHGRYADRRSLGRLSRRRAREGAADLHTSRGPRRRRGGLSHVRYRRSQHAVSRRQRAPPTASADDLYHQQIPQSVGRVLHDEDLAQAIIDRVLERGRLLRLDGPSVRTLHVNLDDAMKEDSDQEAEVARISGKKWPEFPEPTSGLRSPSRNLSFRRRTDQCGCC